MYLIHYDEIRRLVRSSLNPYSNGTMYLISEETANKVMDHVES